MILKKYAVALLQIALLVFGALQVALADNKFSSLEIGQLAALLAGAIVTFFVPLLHGAWAGGLKTGAAVIAAVATLVIPLVMDQPLSPQNLVIVGLAILTALATEVGVSIRKEPTLVSENAVFAEDY